MEFLKNSPGGLISGLIAGLLVNEAHAWLPPLATAITRRAVKRLPFDLRERMLEEWSGHLDEVPGGLAKLWCAVGFHFAAGSITHERIWKGLMAVVQLLARHPVGVWRCLIIWRNWGPAADTMRTSGHDIPWTPFELSPSAFVKRYGEGRTPTFKDDISWIAAWVGANHVVVLALLSLALRKSPAEVLRYMGIVVKVAGDPVVEGKGSPLNIMSGTR